jgi:LmbE family N-acetylglucosaminyl deacetylase
MDPAEARRVRTQEQIASARAVGVDLVEFLDHPDGEVEYGRRLRADLVHAIRRHRPEVLVSLNPHLNTAGGGPNMADHRAVGTAVLDAARDAGNRWLFRRSSPDDLEPWDGVRMVCFAASPSPTHCVDVAEFVEAGIAALKAQHTYIAGLGGGFDPEHYLRDEMSRAGGRAGLLLAVEFEVWPL